jgi:hypothetical protein
MSKKFNIITKNSLAGRSVNVLKIKPKALEQKKTEEYFELDEDSEIGKIDIKHQSVVNKNNFK